MLIRKADKETEAGVLPGQEMLAAMLSYNAEMAKAGVLLQGEGLQASAKGARVKFSGGKPTVMDGPFTETKELIAGFTMIQVKSKALAPLLTEFFTQPEKASSSSRVDFSARRSTSA